MILCVLLVACNDKPADDWYVATGTAEAGFTIKMPVENVQQKGVVDLAGHEVVTHIAIAGDTGITYVASHFELPQHFLNMEETERTDQVWKVFVERLDARKVEGNGPLGADTPTMRNGWFINDEDIRLGVVLHMQDAIGIVVNAGVPESAFGARQRELMQRFFNSLEVQ